MLGPLNGLCMCWACLNPSTTLQRRHYNYSHLQQKTQRGWAPCPRSHSSSMAELGFTPSESDPKPVPVTTALPCVFLEGFTACVGARTCEEGGEAEKAGVGVGEARREHRRLWGVVKRKKQPATQAVMEPRSRSASECSAAAGEARTAEKEAAAGCLLEARTQLIREQSCYRRLFFWVAKSFCHL